MIKVNQPTNCLVMIVARVGLLHRQYRPAFVVRSYRSAVPPVGPAAPAIILPEGVDTKRAYSQSNAVPHGLDTERVSVSDGHVLVQPNTATPGRPGRYHPALEGRPPPDGTT